MNYSPLIIATAVGAGASLALFGTIASLQGYPDDAKTPLSRQIQVDPSPPDREGSLGGYATIVEQVAPSVVSISTSKTVDVPSMEDFFGSDPMLRRFFGFPGPRGPQGPQSAPKQQGLGSGVILTPDGYIVTNNHVVDGADEILVTLSEDKKPHEAEIIGQDPQTDLAVLKIAVSGLPTISVADSSALKVGDTVLAIGNPFGLSQTVTSGIVSALGRSNVTAVSYENFIQTDASINPGNSGGALVDNKGRLIGINTAIISRTGSNIGIGFAIPTNMVMNIADQLIGTGEIQRGYLGVMLANLTPDLAEALQVPAETGVLVDQVLPGTPAEAAGLENGDIILRVDGVEANEVRKTRLAVSNKRPQSKVALEVHRRGEKIDLEVTIGRLPSDGIASLRSPRRSSEQREAEEPRELIPGVTVENLNEGLRNRLNASSDVKGVVITKVAPQSEAANRGLQAGDIITEIGRQPVGSVEEAQTARAEVQGKLALLRVWRDGIGRFIAIPLG